MAWRGVDFQQQAQKSMSAVEIRGSAACASRRPGLACRSAAGRQLWTPESGDVAPMGQTAVKLKALCDAFSELPEDVLVAMIQSVSAATPGSCRLTKEGGALWALGSSCSVAALPRSSRMCNSSAHLHLLAIFDFLLNRATAFQQMKPRLPGIAMLQSLQAFSSRKARERRCPTECGDNHQPESLLKRAVSLSSPTLTCRCRLQNTALLDMAPADALGKLELLADSTGAGLPKAAKFITRVPAAWNRSSEALQQVRQAMLCCLQILHNLLPKCQYMQLNSEGFYLSWCDCIECFETTVDCKSAWCDVDYDGVLVLLQSRK